jgi:hypothetical protein
MVAEERFMSRKAILLLLLIAALVGAGWLYRSHPPQPASGVTPAPAPPRQADLAGITAGPTTGSAQPRNLDAFAKCLGEKKATMYGSFLCPHCADQRKLFGSSFSSVPYVECSVPGSRQVTFPCMAEQIRYTPTWIFGDGERRVGLQSLQALSEKTGCRLP